MTTSNSQQKNFIASLFDFGFTSFVTLRFLKVIYAIMVVIILLVGLFVLIGGLQTGNSLTIIGTIILAPLGTLVYLVLTRITFAGSNDSMSICEALPGVDPGALMFTGANVIDIR